MTIINHHKINDIRVMKKNGLFIILIIILFGCSSEKKSFIQENFSFAEKQTSGMIDLTSGYTHYPRTIAKDGTLKSTNMYDWTSGFFTGNLWYLYENTKDNNWKTEAIKWTESLEPLKNFTDHHDLGFMMYCSYGNAYRLTGNPHYKEVLIQSAKSLCSRFSPITGTIKSWNYRLSHNGTTEWFYPVIIDNMMNLELLFFAYKETGDETFRDIAVEHADNTLKNQFREDYGTYHVVNYDPDTGEVLNKQTMQGYADESTWARGQAWAIYGFTMMYRETKDHRYLDIAIKATDFYLNNPNLPDDLIPYWDFDIFNTNIELDIDYSKYETIALRDASAAAITASALLELCNYSKENHDRYLHAAITTLHNLSENYRVNNGTNQFILNHCVGSMPHHEEIDVPLVYADYYFLEALLRYKSNHD